MKTTELSEQQQAVVRSRLTNIVVVASPGSGKTRTVVERIMDLIESGVSEASIVAITFTNAGAREIQERLKCKVCGGQGWFADQIAGIPEQVPCEDCRGQGGYKLGYVGTVHGFMLRLLRKHYAVVGFSASPAVLGEEQAERIIEEVYEEMSVKGVSLRQMVEEVSHPGDRGKCPSKLQLLADAYFARLMENNLVDFNTLLRHGAKVIESDSRATNWVSHLFVDEFQDSSDDDFKIFQNMAAVTPPPTFCFVGDPDQAIYGFRGGNLHNILVLTQDAQFKTFALQGNYRCGELVCVAAQRLIENNQSRFAKSTVCVTGRPGGVFVHDMADEDAELLYVVRGLRQVMERGTKPEQCAVLLRTNWLVERFTKGLKGYGVPVAENPVATVPPDWRKAKALVAALAEPDNELLTFYYYEHKFGREQAKATKKSKTLSMHRFTLEECGIILKHHWAKGELLTVLEGQDINREARDRVAWLVNALTDDSDLSDLVIAMGKEEEPGEPTPGVVVGTIHSAKGREFEQVWMPALEQGIIPSRRSVADNAREEERRLMYVGMTRVIEGLNLSWSAMRRPSQPEWAKPQPTTPSQFLRELQGKLPPTV